MYTAKTSLTALSPPSLSFSRCLTASAVHMCLCCDDRYRQKPRAHGGLLEYTSSALPRGGKFVGVSSECGSIAARTHMVFFYQVHSSTRPSLFSTKPLFLPRRGISRESSDTLTAGQEWGRGSPPVCVLSTLSSNRSLLSNAEFESTEGLHSSGISSADSWAQDDVSIGESIML